MATHDYDIANQSGAAFRTDLNNALAAIQSNNSNSSSPATTVAYQWWADTTSGTLKIRNSLNNAWVELFQLDGTLTLEDGSNSAPALAFRDDLDTGVFSSAANAFNIATAGVERIEFGTTECVVNDTGADVDFRIEGDTEVNLFYVDAGNDRIGIGTSSPNEELEVAGNIGINANLKHNGDTDTMLSFSANDQVDINCSGGMVARFSTNGISTGTNKRIDILDASDHRAGLINNSDSGANALRIAADPDNSGSSSSLQFHVDGSEQARVNSSGSFLVGTTSDSIFNDTSGGGFNLKAGGQLVIAKEASSTADPLVWLNDTGQTTNKFIVFAQDGSEKSNIGHAGNDLTISVNGSTRFIIDSSGNVGIGTTSPQRSLEVIGQLAVGNSSGAHWFFDRNDSNGLLEVTQSNGTADDGVKVNIDTSGRVMINTAATSGMLRIRNANLTTHTLIELFDDGGTGTHSQIQFSNTNGVVGQITTSGSSTTYATSSDYRLKENATAISDGITRLKTLKPYRFNFKADASTTLDGFFAHEVTAVPEAIIGTKDQVATADDVNDEIKEGDPIYQSIDQSKLVPLLVAAVQELITKVETLEAA